MGALANSSPGAGDGPEEARHGGQAGRLGHGGRLGNGGGDCCRGPGPVTAQIIEAGGRHLDEIEHVGHRVVIEIALAPIRSLPGAVPTLTVDLDQVEDVDVAIEIGIAGGGVGDRRGPACIE